MDVCCGNALEQISKANPALPVENQAGKSVDAESDVRFSFLTNNTTLINEVC